MPKIIENLREKLIEEARKQVLVNGYEKVTMRSIARNCEVGLGTTYNYFKSKEMLVATFMSEDWKQCIQNIQAYGAEHKEPEKLFYKIYDEIIGYAKKNQILFQDESAKKIFVLTEGEYRRMIRNQVSEMIKDTCTEYAKEPTEFLPEFVAESLVSWSISKYPFEKVYGAMRPLFK